MFSMTQVTGNHTRISQEGCCVGLTSRGWVPDPRKGFSVEGGINAAESGFWEHCFHGKSHSRIWYPRSLTRTAKTWPENSCMTIAGQGKSHPSQRRQGWYDCGAFTGN